MQRSFWSHQNFVVLVSPVSCRSSKFIGLCLFLNMKKIFGGMWRKGVYMRGDGSMGWAANWGSSRVSPSHHFLQCDNGANIPLTKYNDAHAPIESRGWSIFREEDSPGGAPLKLMGYQVRRRVVISRMSGGAPLILGILGWHGRDIGAGAAGCLWYPAGTNRGRKQGAKAHFSLSRFGDYPISLTLTSLTGPAELDTIHF